MQGSSKFRHGLTGASRKYIDEGATQLAVGGYGKGNLPRAYSFNGLTQQNLSLWLLMLWLKKMLKPQPAKSAHKEWLN
jgi:hypothetical protein